ncbi:hypothetical protein CPLU01_06672 [Colletotrichum plurivorum]|uniref:Uncharacterized protein n=1 Tax=Colletotrichum plurivorum TaxID=2175906 RepID=A0A8H6NG59_9PEZI|nr:hypothetical protein CPLU01_06672 [Colletotrichum plurivorum]
MIWSLDADVDNLRRSLSLGTCVPQSYELLGPGGYLTLEQQNIESIRLLTDGSCCRKNHSSGLLFGHLALDAFPHLKHLTWTGLSGPSDFKSLAEVLIKRSHQLEELEIDLTWHQHLYDYMHDDEIWFCIYDNVFGSDMVKLCGHKIDAFPVLKRLALVRTPFKEYYYGRGPSLLYDALRRSSLEFLQSLQLRHCYAWEDLIRMFNERAEPVKLKSLELQWISDYSSDGKQDLLTFLRSFFVVYIGTDDALVTEIQCPDKGLQIPLLRRIASYIGSGFCGQPGSSYAVMNYGVYKPEDSEVVVNDRWWKF